MLIATLGMMDCALADDTPAQLKEVAAAWSARESAAKTFDCEFDTQYFHAAKSTSLPGSRGEPIPLPVEDTTVLQKERLRVSGNQYGRYEYSGPQLIQYTHTFEDRSFIAISDGRSEMFFYDGDKNSNTLRFYPNARVRPISHLPEIGVLNNLMPLYAAYRPSAWLQARNLVLERAHSEQEIKEQGIQCLFLRFNDGIGYFDMYLDPRRDFLPIRFETRPRNKVPMLTIRSEMQFEKHDTLGWAPQSWKTTIYKNDGVIRWEYRSDVRAFVANREIPDFVFRFEFPVGTIVENSITGECFLLKEGGRKRHIGEHESVNLEQYPKLLKTESPPTDAAGKQWLILLNVLLAIALVTLLVWRRMASKL